MMQRILTQILYWIASRKVTSTGERARMQLKTILSRVQKFKSFVYGNVKWVESDGKLALLIEILARAPSSPVCSGCGRRGTGYDTLEPRRFEFVPLWGIGVFFVYALRRVNCRRCGGKVESVPWAKGKRTLTNVSMLLFSSFMLFLSP
jgi:transposase